jgi:hypothetical protein
MRLDGAWDAKGAEVVDSSLFNKLRRRRTSIVRLPHAVAGFRQFWDCHPKVAGTMQMQRELS